MSSLKKCQFRSSAHFWIEFCCCCYWVVWAICIFWKLSPCWLHHLQSIFSHSMDYLFMQMVSFALQKLFSLIRSHLCIFAFISIVLGDWSKKTLVWFMSENILSMASSRSFMVACIFFFWLHPTACGILVPQPGIKLMPPALEGRVLTTGPLGKSVSYLIFKFLSHF